MIMHTARLKTIPSTSRFSYSSDHSKRSNPLELLEVGTFERTVGSGTHVTWSLSAYVEGWSPAASSANGKRA
jgi:hypothetical protein